MKRGNKNWGQMKNNLVDLSTNMNNHIKYKWSKNSKI